MSEAGDRALQFAIEANQKRLQKSLERVEAMTAKTMKKIDAQGQQAFKKTEAAAEKAASKIGSAFAGVGKGIAAGFAGYLTAQGVQQLAARIATAVGRFDELGDAAQRLGTNAKFLVQWGEALRESGGNADDLNGSLEDFVGKIGAVIQAIGKTKATKDALAAIGISREQIAAAGSLEQQLLLIAEGISQIEDRAGRAAIADRLGLRPLLPLLEQGREGVRDLASQFDKLGEAAQRGVDETGGMADELERVQKNLGYSSDNLFVKLAPWLIWTYNRLADIADLLGSEGFQSAFGLSLGSTPLGDFSALSDDGVGLVEGLVRERISLQSVYDGLVAELARLGPADGDADQFTAPGYRADLERRIALAKAELDVFKASDKPRFDNRPRSRRLSASDLPTTPEDGAAATRLASDMARDRAAAERDLAQMLGGVAEAEYNLAAAIKRVNELRAAGVVVTKAQEQAIIGKAQAELAEARALALGQGGEITLGVTSQYGQAAEDADTLTESISAADRAQIGLNASLDLFGQMMDGNVRSAGDLLDVLQDVLSQMIRIAAQQAAMGEGSFWSNLLDILGGAVGLGGGGGASQAGGSSYSGPTGQQGGFARGGYTGNGPPTEEAGPAHKGEFYFDAGPTRRIGVSALEALRRGDAVVAPKAGGPTPPGPNRGGPVSIPAGFSLPKMQPIEKASGGGATIVAVRPEVHIHNRAGVNVEAQQSTGPDGQPRLDINIDRLVREKVKQTIGNGDADNALKGRFGASPKMRKAG